MDFPVFRKSLWSPQGVREWFLNCRLPARWCPEVTPFCAFPSIFGKSMRIHRDVIRKDPCKCQGFFSVRMARGLLIKKFYRKHVSLNSIRPIAGFSDMRKPGRGLMEINGSVFSWKGNPNETSFIDVVLLPFDHRLCGRQEDDSVRGPGFFPTGR